jgi:anaerobic ribonucleoside-triphosphate reductase activating protein
MALTAQIATMVPSTEAEGPGLRFALWFQGCPLRCPGCCNPEFLPFHGGQSVNVDDLVQQIRQSRDENGIEGITLLGGEPTAHAEVASALARWARELGLSVMTFTGYTVEELRQRNEMFVNALLDQTDILVDGPYDRTQPDAERRWIGSRNQRIHFLTTRYRADDACWQVRNTLEIRVKGSEIIVNGFPAQNALGLWKGWRRKR